MNDENRQRMDWRAHWRLIFNVIEGVPRMRREITIWPIERGREPTGLTRLAYDIKTLIPVKKVRVELRSDRVELANGYIEYQTDLDADIITLAKKKGLNTPEKLSGISEVVGGENIFIRADISLPKNNPQEEYPVFFFPQDDPRGIQLVEINDPGDHSRRIKWNISNLFYKSKGSFMLEDFQGRHGLRVRQAWEDGKDIFNFYVDSIPIDRRLTTPTHKFLTGPQTFYLGSGPAQERFTGAIYHLEFDPNNSCGTCPKPTITEPDDQ